MAAMAFVKYTQEDYGRCPKIGHKKAHDHFKALREECAPGGPGAQVVTDFTELTDIEWAWQAVCWHPQGIHIVGNGVIAIYGMFLHAIPDPNMRQPRFDLVIASVSVTPPPEAVFWRIHPGSNSWCCDERFQVGFVARSDEASSASVEAVGGVP
jgi:hypothetical protein